jgi:hypothetical protein
MDDRHNPEKVKADLQIRFPDCARFFLLTSAGGNYSQDYDAAVQTILHAGYELSVVIHAKHKAEDCAAAAAGTRRSRREAYLLTREVNEKWGITPTHYVGNLCTRTSDFTKIELLDENRLELQAA